MCLTGVGLITHLEKWAVFYSDYDSFKHCGFKGMSLSVIHRGLGLDSAFL